MAHDRDDTDSVPTENDLGQEIADRDGLGSVVAHLYRGEVDRAVNWRTRLDSTTNWAVTIIAGILAYAFSGQGVSHSIILVAMVVGVMFLFIETRRFQRYDIWRSRVRSMQENLFAVALNPAEGPEQRNWRRQLSEDYRRPDQKIPFQNALAHRLRRVYLPIMTGLLLVWLLRLGREGEPLVQAAAVSGLSGWVVFGAVVVGYASLVLLTGWPNASVATETDQAHDRGDLESDG